ncbi:uncharacterized protein LOC135386414 [Ornithodoros turicata]|uniref:uncharacterized protein LOC135386414 n=1 Tax=Ornithodoros turicata TaxID=34597 RepID=UPI003138F4FA
MKRSVGVLQNTVTELASKIDDLENRARRNNLIINGLEEGDGETNDKLLELVESSVFQKIGVIVQSVELIFRLYDFREKASILRNCNKLKGSTISVSEDFSKKVQHVRKLLWNSCLDDRKNGAKARLVYDKLYLNDKPYCWDLISGSRREYVAAKTASVVNTSRADAATSPITNKGS